jgi:hypothetical protein
LISALPGVRQRQRDRERRREKLLRDLSVALGDACFSLSTSKSEPRLVRCSSVGAAQQLATLVPSAGTSGPRAYDKTDGGQGDKSQEKCVLDQVLAPRGYFTSYFSTYTNEPSGFGVLSMDSQTARLIPG